MFVGNIPDFTVDFSNLAVDVSETTAGVSSQAAFSFSYNGVPSPLITFDESDKTVFASSVSLHGIHLYNGNQATDCALFTVYFFQKPPKQ